MSQKGILHLTPLFLIVAAIGLIALIFTTNLLDFDNSIFSSLYNKPNSHAAESPTAQSTLKIYAAGTSSQNIFPKLILALNGKYVTEWSDVRGYWLGKTFLGYQEYTYIFPNKVTPEQIGLGFANDFFDTSTQADRNLRIDKIILDGKTYQTEDTSVYSVGSFGGSVTAPCGSGYAQSEWLFCNGYFAYAPDNNPPKVVSTVVDPAGSVYGTYQSHNQKVISNQSGIFLTYVHKTLNKDQSTETDTWRLVRSVDNGQTFSTLYEATGGTRAPVIESDSAQNIYLVTANWSSPTQSQFLKFSPTNNYSAPVIQTTLNLNTISAKYSMELDESRSQLYFFAHGNTFSIIGLDGKIKNQFPLTQAGSSAHMHYPTLFIDETGILYAAWTTVDNATGGTYWSIHFAKSENGGIAWKGSNGQPLELPIVADENGPTDRITLNDEFSSHTWLSSFFVRSNQAYFTYYTREPHNRQHFVRYDLATSTIEQNIFPTFIGAEGNISLDTLDGGICVPNTNTTIYCIGRSQSPYGVAVLRSEDRGTTWHDYAVSEPAASFPIYAIGGSLQVTTDGHIIGTYTESDFSDPTANRVIKFFKIAII